MNQEHKGPWKGGMGAPGARAGGGGAEEPGRPWS